MAIAVGAWVAVSPAQAAFPGQNGRIAYDDGVDIYSVNPDGTGDAQLTTAAGWDSDPDWSSDGQRIAFASNRDGLGYQVYAMNADGTGQTRLTDPPATSAGPAWSPDGERIVFARNDGDLWIMNADGSGQTLVASLPGWDGEPDWSPDGSRIAFSRSSHIYTIRPDGSGLFQVTPPLHAFSFANLSPDWSPDGSRIVYLHNFDWDGENCYSIQTVRPDGTGITSVLSGASQCDVTGNYYAGPGWSPDGLRIASTTPTRLFTVRVDGSDFYQVKFGVFSSRVDWQPLPVETLNPHVRPKGATPFRVPLVPAAKPCTAPNRTHGPPLAFGSCNPVQPGSTYLTVGVGDGSPALPRSEGSVRMDVQVGVPGPPEDSDVYIAFRLTNVMRASNLSEYTGELRSEFTVRRTDRDPPGAAPHSTSMDFPFGFTVPCTPTPGSSLDASSCISFTSINAIVPLAIEDTHRAIWELDKLRVYDGGPDEDADTEGDNSLFMTQGVFVP